MSKENLLGYTSDQMESLFRDLDEKPFRGKQLFKWLYNSRQYDFNLMTDLTKDLRGRLDEAYEFRLLKLRQRMKSTDGTEKFLFELDDGHPVETVLIPEEDRRTVCLSSQSGCALACRFCATGTMGLLRNLTVGEMIGQLLVLRERYGNDAFTNVVFMGMGEPFNNYDNLIKAIRIMTDPLGLKIGARKITISTVGITPAILKYTESDTKTNLALSLHAATQEKREEIIPVARKYPLEPLMAAVRHYAGVTGRRVTFEYIMFADFNDSDNDALALARLVQGIPCKINVLAYNPVMGLGFSAPSADKVDSFAKKLYPRTPAVTVRKSRGRDIDAACGQLAARVDK